MSKLDDFGYGDATRKKVHDILNSPEKSQEVELGLAAISDLKIIVSYELEEDARAASVLVLNRIEHLRQLG